MDIKTLESFKLSDAVTFHDELNPKLFRNQSLKPEVKKQLLLIAQDFIDELGISDLNVEDITISGSNAAYSYTPYSDLDLHILVDMSKLPNDDVYAELFTAKKTVYNDSHDIKIHNIPVELYVQDSNQTHISLGEYSLLKDKWLRIPTKRRANFDQSATKVKYEKLLELIKYALKTKSYSKIKNTIDTIKRYRQTGLSKGGEFGPENLAYKVLRNQGYIDKLYNMRDKLHSELLTIETMYQNINDNSKLLNKQTLSLEELSKKHNVDKSELVKQLNMGIKVELEHTKDKSVAKEIALDHLGEDPKYYTKLKKIETKESVKVGWNNPTKKFKTISEEVTYIARLPNLNWDTKIALIENASLKRKDVLTESIDKVHKQVEIMINSFDNSSPKIKEKYIPVMVILTKDNLMFFDIALHNPPITSAEFGELIKIEPNALTLKFGSEIKTFPDNVHRELSLTYTMLIDSIEKYEKLRMYVELTFELVLPPINHIKESASGYIPSNSEKNDPRYKTALTVDIKPNTLQKNAKKLGFKISRSGIPPLLRP